MRYYHNYRRSFVCYVVVTFSFFRIFISKSKNKGRTRVDENHQLQSLKRQSPFALAFVPLHLHRCATIAIWKLPVKLASRTGIQSYPETATTFPILTVYLPRAIFYRFRGYIGKNFDTDNFPNREIMVGDVVRPLFVEPARTRVSRETRWLSPAIQHWLFIDLTRTKPELSCFVARWNSLPWNHL